MKVSIRWIIGVSILVTLMFVLAADHYMSSVLVEYPLDTWRMDLDDAVTTVLATMVALAAVITAGAAWRKAGKVEHTMNGGMSSMASQIIIDELRTADIETGLGKRVKFLEDHYEDCLKREVVWNEERKQIRQDRKLLRDMMESRLGEDD